MAAKASKVDDIVKKTADLSINEIDRFYPNQKGPINFARLEKGLLLFIYTYETAKETLASEMALWDHRVCAYMIKDGKCTKTLDQCRHEHRTTYRQKNLCSYWYINDKCEYGTKCKHSHHFHEVSKYHRYLRTDTEANVYRLVRFVRNFAGHYLDSRITNQADQQDLYKNVVIVMVHLVHYLSPKKTNSIEHLNLFLEATTINQLIAEKDLLIELQNSFEVPTVFFDLNMNFNTNWYRSNSERQTVDCNQLSSEFILVFNHIFKEYFEGRLKSRGAKAPWR